MLDQPEDIHLTENHTLFTPLSLFLFQDTCPQAPTVGITVMPGEVEMDDRSFECQLYDSPGALPCYSGARCDERRWSRTGSVAP